MFNKLHKNKTRGALLVEAAIILPLFLYLFICMAYLALLMHDYMGLNNIARNAVRYAAVNAARNENGAVIINQQNVETAVGSTASTFLVLYNYNASGLAINTNSITTGTITEHYVNVSVEAARPEDIPLIVSPVLPDKLSSSLKMRCELEEATTNPS